jgi:predicted double-glycine peptidase
MQVVKIAGVYAVCINAALAQTFPTDIQTHSLFSQTTPTKSWQSQKFQAITKQWRDFSCGPAAISTLISSYLGGDMNEEKVWQQIKTQSDTAHIAVIEKNGASFLDLKKATVALGYQAEGYKINFEELLKITDPVIVHMNKLGFKHYSVYRGHFSGRVYLADSLRGNITLSQAQFQAEWSGNVLAVWQSGKDIAGIHALSLLKDKLPDIDVLERDVIHSLQNPLAAAHLIPKW